VDDGELCGFAVVADHARQATEVSLIAEHVDASSVDVLVDTYFALGDLQSGASIIAGRYC
jgi:hypothetical protein